MKRRLIISSLCAPWLITGLAGCASTRSSGELASSPAVDSEIGRGEEGLAQSGSFEIEGHSYPEVFAAAREVIGQYRFGVNRVDAARGVITSFPKRSEGLASFWDHEQSTLGQEIEDLANQQERTIRIEFDRDGAGAVVRARVGVLIERVHRPGWRVEVESIRLSSFAHSLDAYGNRLPSEFREPIGHDRALADRIAASIAKRFR